MTKVDFLKKVIEDSLSEVRAMQECDHTVGIYWDQSDTDLVLESELETNIANRYLTYYVGDVQYFIFCPDCGSKLDHKEKYKDAVEMVQMP